VALGGDATGSGGSVHWSLGQIADEVQNGETGVVSQGVQQTFANPSLHITPTAPRLDVRAFPTVTDNVVNLILPASTGSWRIGLYDANGRMLQQTSMRAGDHTLSLQGFAAGVHHLHVIDTDGTSYSFTLLHTDLP